MQPNKAVVGSSAFAHESGIHQHGVLSNRATYEIMDPVEIGLEGNSLVLGKHSGRHAFVDALDKIGVTLDEDHMNRAFGRFKDLADRKVQITDQDLSAIVAEELGATDEDVLVMESLQMGGGTHLQPRATVRLRQGRGGGRGIRDGRRPDRRRDGRDPTGVGRRGSTRELPRVQRDRRHRRLR